MQINTPDDLARIPPQAVAPLMAQAVQAAVDAMPPPPSTLSWQLLAQIVLRHPIAVDAVVALRGYQAAHCAANLVTSAAEQWCAVNGGCLADIGICTLRQAAVQVVRSADVLRKTTKETCRGKNYRAISVGSAPAGN